MDTEDPDRLEGKRLLEAIEAQKARPLPAALDALARAINQNTDEKESNNED